MQADRIQKAYGVPDVTRSRAGRAGFGDERFDIIAKASSVAIPEGATTKTREAMTMEMLQALLEQRFKLTIHREAKEMPVYELVVGKNGLNFVSKIQAVKD